MYTRCVGVVLLYKTTYTHQLCRSGIITQNNLYTPGEWVWCYHRKQLAHTRCVGVVLLHKTTYTHQVCRCGITTQNNFYTPDV